MKTKMKELRCIGVYKDGGSKVFVDKYGENYWLCNRLGLHWEPYKGVLFRGKYNSGDVDISNEAKGTFKLIDNKSEKIIKQ